MTVTQDPAASGPSTRLVFVWSIFLFLCLLAVYWFSLPTELNQSARGCDFFGNDETFIVNQFKRGKTYTYSDHILYHLLALYLYNHADLFPLLPQDVWIVHKILSVFFGAAGAAILFFIGVRETGSIASSLFAALFVAGSVSYWFFSSTVDTYTPAVCVSILALGSAMKCLHEQKPVFYFLFGIAAGTAFFFRSDGIFLAVLGLVLFGTRQKIWLRSSALLSGWIITVGIFCATLSFNMPAEWEGHDIWTVAPLEREHQIRRQNWASMENISAKNLGTAAFIHGAISVISPDLKKIEHRNPVSRIIRSKLGRTVLLLYGIAMTCVLYNVLFRPPPSPRKERDRRNILLAVAAAWFISRVVLYTWWNPREPFLFAIMSLPALWIVFLLFQRGGGGRFVRLVFPLGLVLMVWFYNFFFFIVPFRAHLLR